MRMLLRTLPDTFSEYNLKLTRIPGNLEEMMNFDQWPIWKRALLLNALTAIGVGFAFGWLKAGLSLEYCVPVGVFIFALVNFMFLAVRPRILAGRAAGLPKVSALRVLVSLVRERPLIVVLVVLQLVGVSRSATTAITFFQWAHSDSVQRLSDASALVFRMTAMSEVMTGVALVWLLSAIGLWKSRSWAWWLALVLNGLAVVSVVPQFLNWHAYALNAKAIIAVVLLLLPTVRNECRNTAQHLQARTEQ